MDSRLRLILILLFLPLLSEAAFRKYDCQRWLVKPEPGTGVTFVLGTQPRIETERLILRPLDLLNDDPGDMQKLIMDMPPDTIQVFSDADDPDTVFADLTTLWSKGVRFWPAHGAQIIRVDLVVVNKESGRIIGLINLSEYDNLRVEVGYSIHSDYRKRGYATEAVGAAIRDIEKNTGPRMFYGWAEHSNAASFAVMKKLGFESWVEQADVNFMKLEPAESQLEELPLH